MPDGAVAGAITSGADFCHITLPTAGNGDTMSGLVGGSRAAEKHSEAGKVGDE